jgi:hypothetical protein
MMGIALVNNAPCMIAAIAAMAAALPLLLSTNAVAVLQTCREHLSATQTAKRH